MNITYKNTITVDEVNAIRKSMGWRQQHPDQLQEQLGSVDLIISAYDKDIAVGAAIGQGYILVMPEYQYQGIENEFMEQIINHTRSKLKPGYGTQIDIRAFGDRQIALYESLGFQISTVEQRGVPMHICVTNQMELTDRMFNQMEFKEDTRIYNQIQIKESITEGLSKDEKFYIETTDKQRLILRISDIAEYDRKKAAFKRMELMAAADVPMSRPVEFGICEGGKSVYQLLTWCDGDNLEKLLPKMSEAEQYAVGLKAGEILRKIHEVSVSEEDMTVEDWNECYSSFIDESIKSFHDCGVKVDGSEVIINYFNINRHLMKTRPRRYIHGDYHVGNMMYSAKKRELYIIDWEIHLFNSYGDPWKEISMQETPHFSTGMIRGYFNGEPPKDYWHILAFYTSIGAVSAVPWAYYGHPDLLGSVIQHSVDVLKWFDNMTATIPTWYLKGFYVQYIDGIPYKLEAAYDFSFMEKYGKVFKVFDEQGSGNIAFGIEKDGKKYFIKFAGAPKPNYISNRDSGEVDTVSAIELLKKAVPLYTELAHPTLIKFISAEEIGGGYAAVFEWEDAIGIEPKDSPHYMKFMQMPIEQKMRAFEDIVEFHIHVAAKGYVALDFYDGSILYDYEKEKVIICDIDLYQKSPFINVGSLGIVGSARYVSPEECVKDAVMDEITNIYTMGAAAFALFAYGDRSSEAWTLNSALYDVAKKAVSDEQDNRQKSIEQFIQEWRIAK